MKRKVALFSALGACLVSPFPLVSRIWFPNAYPEINIIWVPLVWFCCVALTLLTQKWSGKTYKWILLTAPLALSFWLIALVLLVGVSLV